MSYWYGDKVRVPTMEGNNPAKPISTATDAPEHQPQATVIDGERNFGEQYVNEGVGSEVQMNIETDDMDSTRFTPKTSNRRAFSITEDSQEPASLLSAINEQGSLSLQNPLHASDEDVDSQQGLIPLYESHFEVDREINHDLRPVAPKRKPSYGAFQGSSPRLKALEKDLDFDEDVAEELDVATEEDIVSAASSYVGDVDERHLQDKDVQFRREVILPLEPNVSLDRGTSKQSSVHTEATSAMSASGVTTNTNPVSLSLGCTTGNDREIVFGPDEGNIEGTVESMQDSFRGYGNGDTVGKLDKDTELRTTGFVDDAGLVERALFNMEQMLDAALNDDVVIKEAEACTSEKSLSESIIPSESFLKMGEMMQSQFNTSGDVLEETTGDTSNHLDVGLIVAGVRKGESDLGVLDVKDGDDDLLDTILGDEMLKDKQEVIELKADKYIKDSDEVLLEAILTDNETNRQKTDEYVPDEEMRKLEELLDEGLADHQKNKSARNFENTDNSEKLRMEASDSMARELDALLGGDLEEEVNFDIDEAPLLPSNPSHKTHDTKRTSRNAATKVSCANPKRSGMNMASNSITAPSQKVGMGRFFGKQTHVKAKERPVEKISPKTHSELGYNRATRKGSSTTRKKETIALTPSDDSRASTKNTKRPERGRRSTFMVRRFMLPTIAYKTHVTWAAEERAAKDPDKSSGSPSQRSLKPSWRSGGRSFMSSTFSSLRKLRSNSPSTSEKVHKKERRHTGDVLNPNGTKSRITGAFMESTFSKTMLETETRIAEERRALEKEEEASKIIVDLSPLPEDRKSSPFLDYSFATGTATVSSKEVQSPGETNLSDHPKRRVLWTPSNSLCAATKETTVPRSPIHGNVSSQSVFSPRSYGSLSSQCSIRSFVSPDKAGIIGCQSKYDPCLLRTRGPCELCVFRLSEEAMDELDEHGRHLMVQFTSGGCPNCLEFPRSFDEGPVRLCPRCYAVSHRPRQSRRRKKGYDAARIGYSFAKAEYA